MPTKIKQFGLPSFYFLILFIFSIKINAQQKISFIRAKKGIAYTNLGKKIWFKSVKETENSFVFLTKNKTEVEIDKMKIARIQKRRGTKGFRYTLTAIGGSVLVVFNGYYISSFYDTPRSRSIYEGEIAIVTFLLSSLSGTIAGLVGLSQKRYKTIYKSSDIGSNYKPNLKLITTTPNAIPSLTLSYSF